MASEISPKVALSLAASTAAANKLPFPVRAISLLFF